MIQTSFSDKIKILVDVSSSSRISIIAICILTFMALLFLTTNKKNSKSSKKLYLYIYIFLIGIILIKYYDSLAKMFDYMMNNFFIGFYFPNLAIYLVAIIATNIILLKTIFNFKEDKLLKFINIIIYCIIHYILILILNIITSNKLDVFDQTSVYKNNNASALIGLSSTIFVVWIIFLIVYKTIRKSQKKHQKVRIPVRRIIRYKKKLPENYQTINLPNTLFGNAGSYINKAAYVEDNLLDFYKTEESKNQNDLLKEYESMFSLNDYKKMIEILNSTRNLQNNEIEQKQDLIIEDNNINQSLSQVVENVEEDDEIEQPKLEELLNLYKSI